MVCTLFTLSDSRRSTFSLFTCDGFRNCDRCARLLMRARDYANELYRKKFPRIAATDFVFSFAFVKNRMHELHVGKKDPSWVV
jgi:hypothetical protein